MARLIYNEAASPTLYRWLSFLRLLMSVHPRVGADIYEVYFGNPKNGLAPGWNAVYEAYGDEIPARYIWIGPESGRTTETRPPVPDEQMHVVYNEDLPIFEETTAWLQLSRLAEILVRDQPQGVKREWVQERIDLLRSAAQTPLHGEDEEVDRRISQALARIRDIVNGPDGTIHTFEEPILNVVHDYLDFQITRRQASNIAAILLSQFAIKFPSPLDRTGGADPVKKQIDHLISLTSKIISERHGYDLGSYSQLTYLGLFWAEAATIMSKELGKRSQGETLRHWFNRRALYIEELAVHELTPSLIHPASLMPFGLREYERARTVGIINTQGLYAGAGDLGEGPLDPEEVWKRVEKYSATNSTLEIGYEAFGEFLSSDLAFHLETFLLTMKLGQSMR